MVNAGDTDVNVGVLPWESQYQVIHFLTLAFPSPTPVRDKSSFSVCLHRPMADSGEGLKHET